MTRCKHCGARALPLQSVCDYCGTPYRSSRDGAWTVDTPGGRAGQDGLARVEGRRPKNAASGDDLWQQLYAHPDLERLLLEGPERPIPTERREGSPLQALILLVFAGIAMGAIASRGVGGAPSGMMLFFAVPAVLSLMRRHRRGRAFPGAPLEATPARILEVTEPWSRTEDPRPRALIETEPGYRRHLRLRRDLIGALGRGDWGVAFVKADVLIDFRHLSWNGPR